MLTFGAESPRSDVDQVTLNLSVDEAEFVVLDVSIPARDLRIKIRLGNPTAMELGERMQTFGRYPSASRADNGYSVKLESE